MTFDQVVVLLVLACAVVLWIIETIPLGVVGISIIAALGLSGVLDPHEAVSAFSKGVVVLVGSLYVVSAALIRTGVVGALEGRLLHLGRGSERRLVIVATIAVAVVSTVLNNTSVVVLMLPILLGAARSMGIAPSRVLMPMSFAAILGGTMTLIGTSTNVLVADLAESTFTIRFLDFLPVGAGFAAVGLLYLWFVAPRLLPERPTVSSVTRGEIFDYVTELLVREDGPAVGTTPTELSRRLGASIRILQLVRDEEVLDRFAPDTRLEAGDILVTRGTPEAIVALRRDLRLQMLSSAEDEREVAPRGHTFAEVVITPASELLGRTLRGLGLKRRFSVVALALQRRGAHLRHGITEVPLRIGDVILIQGTPDDVERLRDRPGLILLIGVEEKVVVRRRAPVAVAIIASFIVLAALGLVDLPLLAVGGAAACLLTGCIQLRGAIRDVDWNVLGLLAGAVTLGMAMHRTGLAAEAAHVVVGITRELGPGAVLSAIYLITAVATECVSNAGAAALMVPISLATADELQVSGKPFVFAVAYAASASFSTPVGYQTNAFIHGPGGYRFRDFLRVGVPLQIVLWIYASLVIPVFFPF